MSEDINYRFFNVANKDVLNDLYYLEKKVFPKPNTKEKLKLELSAKQKLSIIIAYYGEEPVGYKVGFERSKRNYYSWIGGVSPSHRKKGIAMHLMALQHDYAKKHGFRVISTQTDNSFKDMIILNIKSGFEIRGTIQGAGDNYITIIMEKEI